MLVPASHTVLLLVDLINHFKHPRGSDLLAQSEPIWRSIRDLKDRARHAGIPVIYVNDNFGSWQTSFEKLMEIAAAPEALGSKFVELLRPEPEDYFVLKPKHSGFFQTPLEILLKHLEAENLIITGLSTNSCVLYTSSDAYMRDFHLYVPGDCVAACTMEEHHAALKELSTMLKAETAPSASYVFT